jgi:hypothetical protein
VPRPCIVTLTDLRGIRHVAEVNADSLFEAAVVAPHAFRASGWTEGIGPATRVEVEVRLPITRHVVSVGQIERWTRGRDWPASVPGVPGCSGLSEVVPPVPRQFVAQRWV